MTALVFGSVGVWVAMAAASQAYSALTAQTIYKDVSSVIQVNDRLLSTVNLERQAAAYVLSLIHI